MALDGSSTHIALNVFDTQAPPLGVEITGIGSPEVRVRMHAVCIPSDIGPRLDGNLASQKASPGGVVIDHLRDRGVET